MKRTLLKSLFLALTLALSIILALSACSTPTPVPATAPVETPSAGPTAELTLNPTEAPRAELTVLAASSLTEVFTQIAKDYEASNANVKITLSFAGSQDLVAQITSGVKADVFASASKSSMDALVEQGFVAKGAPITFAGNKLVVVCRSTLTPSPVFEDLGSKDLLLVIAEDTVPVGKYTLQMLDKIIKTGKLAGFAEKFMANVVSKEVNVKLVLQKVELGEADCGIVYATDAKSADQSKVLTLDVPEEYNIPASYPISVLKDSTNSEAAAAFLDYIFSDDGQATLQSFGFTKP